MLSQRLSRIVTVLILAGILVGSFPGGHEASAATSASVRIDAAHELIVTASADVNPSSTEVGPEFAGVSETTYGFDLFRGGRRVGTLSVVVRSLPGGNIAVFSRLDAPDDEVDVSLEVRAMADSHTFRGLDPQTQPVPPLDTHFGQDRTTNPIGIVEFERGGQRTSSLFLGKAYEFRELTRTYPGGKRSWVKELVEEDSAYSVGRAGGFASTRLFLRGNGTSCERYFVVSPRPILDGTLGSTDFHLLMRPRFRWVDPDGPLMKGPWSIEPSTREGYIRSLQQLRSPAVLRETLETGSPFMKDMTYNGLYSLWKTRSSDGLWRTHWTSTWVGAESGIVAPYIDSRHNELIALWFLEFARSMDVTPELAGQLREMALPYADFLLERAAEGEAISTGRGHFFPAYFNDPGGTHSFATLNHSLGVMRYLILTHQETGRAKYLSAALAIRDAVRDTTPGWIRESGDLWYGYKRSGEFFDQDYPTLTLTDLVVGQDLLETVVGRREPAFDTLIRSKVTFLNEARFASASLGVSGSATPLGTAEVGGSFGDEGMSHLPGGWWAAPDETESEILTGGPAPAASGPTASMDGAVSLLDLPELGNAPVTGVLGRNGVTSVFYLVRVPEGRIVRARLVGPAASDFDMMLYAPGADTAVANPVAMRTTYLYPETLSYVLPADAGGDYVLEVRAKWGEGEYTLSREILVPTHSGLADAFEAETPLTGRIEMLSNRRDTHWIRLQEGDHVYATVNASASNQVGLRLLGPEASESTDGGALGPAYADRISYTVPVGGAGRYYFDVHCAGLGGSYRVDYTVRQLEEAERLPGLELSGGESVTGRVHWGVRPREVYSIELAPGETVRVGLRRPTAGEPIDAYFYPPGTTSFRQSEVASARGWGRDVGFVYTAPQEGGGTYHVVVHSPTGSGDYTLSALRPGTPVAVGGENRYATAVEASRRAYPDGLAADGEGTVVIATGRNWPDALGGAALAGVLDGPILLVARDALPEVTSAEIVRLRARKAVVLGGTAAVDETVQAALENMLGAENVSRIAGSTRYATADAVARRVIALRGSDYDGSAFVATGRNFADALAAAPISAAQGRPLFLVNPQTGLSDQTRAAMQSVTDVSILGGESAVTANTEFALRATYGAEKVIRLSGGDRYATAAAIAEHAVTTDGHVWNRVGITTGQRFPDALAGGVLQGRAGSVMLLTRSDRLESATRDTLAANRFGIATLTYFGGENAITTPVRAAVSHAIE